MPKVALGNPNYEKIFGAKLKASVIGSGKQCKQAAQFLGICDRTLSDRFKNPAPMTLGQLKLLIKMTDMPPDIILQYLYEGKTTEECSVRRKE
ncbi:MAG: hypothetical protein J6B68_01675 [Lachnospiraceae bacterium]|nr:hypothetical protein [Lachnospiraceae bacterium]MBP3477556.1 hypothetical protein [Lachnospiraceae bacterium]